MSKLTAKNAHDVTVPATGAAAEVQGLAKKAEVAKAAQVSQRTVEVWMSKKLIPWIAIGPRCVRFHIPSVLAALRRLEIKEVR